MAAPARPAAASVSGSFTLPPDARCSFDQPRRREQCLQDDRMARTLVYSQPESYPKDAVVAAVEECMRRQAEGLLHSLDGIGGRLSQLELYCYKLERSIGELRSDVMDYHGCVEKNLRQVQQAVQILQDRQDLADAPKDLAKLQIPHEISAQRSEATASSVLGTRENDQGTHVAKQEVTLLPVHQVNGMQAPAIQVQSSNGYVLQHLVPVSLSTQHEQQQVNQAPVYYMQSQDHPKSSESKRVESVVQVVQHDQQQVNQAPPMYYVQSQDHAKCTESKTVDSVVQVVQPLIQNPEARVAVEQPPKSSQPTESYPQAQNHWLHMPAQQVESHTWHSQQSMVQQQQYIIQQVPQQMAQQQSSSPHSQGAPQGTPLYPAYNSQKPANPNTEQISRSVALHTSYSSPQQKHHEVAHTFYGQANTILLPVADHHNIQQQQPHSLQPHSQGPCPPQQSKPNHCSVASYAVQGNGQNYSSTYKNPSNCPAAVVAVVPQPPATTMAFHHLGPQVVHNHPFGNMAETASVVGYPRDRVETLPAVTAAQLIDSNVMVDKLNAGSNVTSPREWAA